MAYKSMTKKGKVHEEKLQTEINSLKNDAISLRKELSSIRLKNLEQRTEIEQLKKENKIYSSLKKNEKTMYNSVVTDMIQGTGHCQKCEDKQKKLFEQKTKLMEKQIEFEKLKISNQNLMKDFTTTQNEKEKEDRLQSIVNSSSSDVGRRHHRSRIERTEE